MNFCGYLNHERMKDVRHAIIESIMKECNAWVYPATLQIIPPRTDFRQKHTLS